MGTTESPIMSCQPDRTGAGQLSEEFEGRGRRVQRCCYNLDDWGDGAANLICRQSEDFIELNIFDFAWAVDCDPSAGEEMLCQEAKISVFGFGDAPMQLTLTYNIDGSQTYDFEQECMVNKSDEVRQLSWDEQTILMPIHDGAHTLTICCNDPNFNIEAVRIEPDDKTRANASRQEDEGDYSDYSEDEEPWGEEDRQEYLRDDLANVREQYSGGGDPLSDLLDEMGLSQYAAAFNDELGVTEMADLEFLTEEDLNGIGIKGPKARRFLQVCK